MRESILLRDTGVSVCDVLRGIAEGQNALQILSRYRMLTSADIMAAAKVAAEIIESYVTVEHEIVIEHEILIRAHSGRVIDVSKVREEFPRAYEPWSEREDHALVEGYRHGLTVAELAKRHQRQLGAVRSRLKKLGELTPKKNIPEPGEAG